MSAVSLIVDIVITIIVLIIVIPILASAIRLSQSTRGLLSLGSVSLRVSMDLASCLWYRS